LFPEIVNREEETMAHDADRGREIEFTACRRGNMAGFTLVELLITLAIVAIVASIALPLYSGKVEQARQTGAQRNLVALSQAEEIYRFQNGTYTATLANLTSLGWKNDTPAAGELGHYDFTITAATTTAFTIQATGDIGSGTEDKWTIDQDGTLAPG
jgi:type IV pilus assembly protein PilE